jgi:CxxC-x17-CxxC domain-containing protein
MARGTQPGSQKLLVYPFPLAAMAVEGASLVRGKVRGTAVMEYHDRVLKCSECGAEFVFTGGEQMFFADKGFKNEPKRCKGCKAKRAEGGGGSASPMRSETKTSCSQCGKETTVPFRPTQGRPVFCRECFQQRRAIGAP